MNLSLKITVAKLILVNLIPVFGVLFFEWDLFEIGVAYVVETAAIYAVFELDHYFIDKHTRFPFVMAVIQLAFTALTFGALMLGTVMILYEILMPDTVKDQLYYTRLDRRLGELQILIPFCYFFILELITFYIRKRNDSLHVQNSTWRVLGRILFSHLYIAVGAIILAFLPNFLLFHIPFFIGLKLVLEYSTDDERIFKKLWTVFLESAIGKRFRANPKKKPLRKGYLSENGTSILRRIKRK